MTEIRKPMSAFSESVPDARAYALAYAGEGGVVATLPDIVEGRLSSAAIADSHPLWQESYGTASTAYIGFGEDGRKKIIVVHGADVGPLATQEALEAAYGRKSKRGQTAGFVSAGEFRRLEKGEYGKVQLISPEDPGSQITKESFITMLDQKRYASYMAALVRKSKDSRLAYSSRLAYLRQTFGPYTPEEARYLYELDKNILYPGDDDEGVSFTAEQVVRDALLMMMLGPRGGDYVAEQEKLAKKLLQRGPLDPIPRTLDVPENLGCVDEWCDDVGTPDGMTAAWIIGIGGFSRITGRRGRLTGVTTEISVDPHDRHDFIGVPKGAKLGGDLGRLPAAYDVLVPKSEFFLRPTGEHETGPLLPVEMNQVRDGRFFTCYSDREDDTSLCRGEGLEFPVTEAVKIGEPKTIVLTDIFFGYFKYPLAAVKAVQPEGTNAYTIEHIGKRGDGATEVTVQFYKAKIDTSRRLPPYEEAAVDFDTLMRAGGIDRGESEAPESRLDRSVPPVL